MHTWLRALSLSLVVALSACGGGGSSSSTAKTPPTANFAFSCVDLACNFVNTSTSQDPTDSLIAYTWTFGDGSATASTVDAAHTYAAASTYTVSMLVIDSQGLRSTATRTITVTAPPAIAGPHASFTVSCISLDCTFTDTSTYDTGSVAQSRLWDFGDTVTLATTNPVTHTYPLTPQPTTYTARLTVTDAAGNSSTNVQNVLVAPPATTASCVSASCSLILTQAARVTVTLVSHSCLAKHDTVLVTAPVAQTLFSNGCVDTTGVPVSIGGGTLFPAGTALQLSVLSGTLSTTTIAFPPAIRLSGDFTQGWTLIFDDGYGGPAEPDFNDLVLLVKATP